MTSLSAQNGSVSEAGLSDTSFLRDLRMSWLNDIPSRFARTSAFAFTSESSNIVVLCIAIHMALYSASVKLIEGICRS